jgi:hypothetical protein
MKTKEWFHAQIRWAVLVEGKKGLRSWEESAYIFLGENHERAFQQALVMGRRHENIRKEGHVDWFQPNWRKSSPWTTTERIRLSLCWFREVPKRLRSICPSIIVLILRAVSRLPVFEANLAGGGRNSGRPTGSLRFTLHRPPAFLRLAHDKKKSAERPKGLILK